MLYINADYSKHFFYGEVTYFVSIFRHKVFMGFNSSEKSYVF